MKRIKNLVPQTMRGMAHRLITLTDADIARAAGVSTGSVAVARHRGELSDLEGLLLWINWHRILNDRRRLQRLQRLTISPRRGMIKRKR